MAGQREDLLVTPEPGAVAVRGDRHVTGTPDWYVYPGHWLSSACSSESGGYYSACGGSDRWFRVSAGLISRYMAASCVRLVVDRA